MDNNGLETLQKQLQDLKAQIDALSSQRIGKLDIIPTSIKPGHLANSNTPNKGDTFFTDGNSNFSPLSLGQTGNLMWVSGGQPAWLANGSTNQVLTIVGGVPAWASSSSFTASGVSVSLSAGQSVTNSSDVLLTFDTKAYDLNTEFDTATHTFTAANAGKYIVIFTATVQSLATGQNFYTKIYKNGSEFHNNDSTSAGNLNTGCMVSSIESLAASDTLKFYVQQGDAVSRTVVGSFYTNAYVFRLA